MAGAIGKGKVASDVAAQSRRAFWLKHLHQWHWVSSALCLIAMLGFAITGITLNHAGAIEAKPVVTEQRTSLPEALRPALAAVNDTAKPAPPVPAAVADWIAETLGVTVADRPVEWSAEELYISLPRPGGDAWLSIDRESGAVLHEVTDRGWVSYFNDLHKGRNTGAAWAWFIDIAAGACLVFCLTGLFLLQMHARNRPTTWPLVGLGLVAPLLLMILLIH
nr:PepSY-associated TM helix domain-containing protein [Niveispirillum sp. BGYR6]